MNKDLYSRELFMLSAAPLMLFFFFQAEDGIRDWSVTGVQTCALPILSDDERRPRLVDVSAQVMDGRLQVEWAYSAELHREETVAGCAERMLSVLRELIDRKSVV